MALTLDGTNGIVSSGSITTQSATGVIFSDSSNQGAAASPFSLKNRIINGDMVISQRNGTSSVTPIDGQYTIDRWLFEVSQTSKLSVQQNAGSVTPPAGFTNYLGITSLSAYSIGSGDYFAAVQRIEGFNIADLAWGTANARTVTLSFWVRSSLTGTFGGGLKNGSSSYNYPFSYTINSANTWEQKSITILGATSGLWSTDIGLGVQVYLGLGVGSTYSATPGVWTTTNVVSATGATSVVGTNGATFYVTGVQLERNTTATPFEWIPYGTELSLCQRYYQTLPFDTGYISVAATIGTGSARGPLFQLNQNMRVAPTVTLPATGSAAGQLHYTNSSGAVPATIGTNGVLGVQVNSFRVEGDGYNSAFTAGQAVMLRIGTGAGASITASAEL
jgi:hypothetical protein